MSTPLPPAAPDAGTIDAFERDGYAVIRAAITQDLRDRLLTSAEKLLASNIAQGRDRGGDGKDGFRGCLNLDRAFLPLLANPAVLPTVVQLLSPNIHLLSAHLIALPSGPPRTIRIPSATAGTATCTASPPTSASPTPLGWPSRRPTTSPPSPPTAG